MASGRFIPKQRIINWSRVYKMYQEEWSIRALSRLLLVSEKCIRKGFEDRMMPVEPFHDKIDEAQLVSLVRQGLSQKRMAEKLNVAATTLARALGKLRATRPNDVPPKDEARAQRAKKACGKRINTFS